MDSFIYGIEHLGMKSLDQGESCATRFRTEAMTWGKVIEVPRLTKKGGGGTFRISNELVGNQGFLITKGFQSRLAT